ncbi:MULTISPECIES: FAD-binding oxidoreductase [unclassified Nocardiopsis]|uniref:FAD-binding oxidoreductase n=1 Tax=unclassified Nocardiopsis TaxID=2649073 RepID=UPI001357E456|nr:MULTISPECIES: FAD-binding oxidoreductase [unclassified Nocardiopsis]
MTLAEGLDAGGRAPRAGTDADAVGGLVPAHVVRPADTADLGRVLAKAAGRGLAVVARGGGTALDWGSPPRRLDLLVDTTGLSWIEHIAGDLVVEVGAGTPVAELYDALAAAGQRLSADPVRTGGTVGGMVATGVSGPRRLLSGALRDLVIGMTVVRADGVVARSGGRVVKNVAGYDLAKLHTGGLGTLGVVASVAFRLHPAPPALRLVSRAPRSPEEAEEALAALRRTAVVPSAVELDRSPEGGWRLEVVLEGTPDGLAARVAETARALGGDPEAADALPGDWGLLPRRGTLALVSVPPAESVRAAARVGGLAASAGARVRVRGSLRTGTLYACLPPGTPAEAVRAVAEGVRARPGWSATLLRAEPHVHDAGVDPWGEVPGLPLMRALKDSFDPDHRLAPGRFAGGI